MDRVPKYFRLHYKIFQQNLGIKKSAEIFWKRNMKYFGT